MDKKVIEELDIIVQAEIESARSDLKLLAKDIKQLSNAVSKSLNNINKSGQLNDFKKEIKKSTDEIRNVKKEIENITIDGVGGTFKVKADMSDFEEQIANAKEEIQKPICLTDNIPDLPEDEFEKAEYRPKVELDTSEAKKEISELEYNLNNLDALTLKDEIKTIGMQIGELAGKVKQSFNDTSIGQAFSKSIDEWKIGLDTIKTKIDSVKNSVKDSTFGQAISQSIDGWKMGFDAVHQKVSSIKESFGNMASNIQSKIQPVTSIFKNIGIVAKNSFIQATSNIKEMANTTGHPINKLKQLISNIKLAGKESKIAKKHGIDFSNSFGNSLKKGVKSIKRFALSLLSVRSAFTMISRACHSYLNFDSQLQESIQNSWNVLGSLLAPALEYVANLFNQLVSIVAKLVQTMTGIDLVARANAKGLKKQEEQAKKTAKANKQLASIDDINTLSSNNNNNDGEQIQKIEVQPVDTKPIEKFIKKVKELFKTLFKPFEDAWNNVGAGVFESLISMLESIGELCNSVFSSFEEIWSNGTGEEIITNVLLQWQTFFDIIGGVSDALREAWDTAGTGTAIVQEIANILKDIQQLALSISGSFKKWIISESFKDALKRVFSFFKDIFEIAQQIADWILSMYEKYLKPVLEDKILPAISKIVIAISDVWKVVKPVVDKIIQIIERKLEPVIKGLSELIGGIVDVISGIADFVSGIFTLNWDKAWNGIKKIFKGVWDSFSGIIKTPINLIIDGVEGLVNVYIKGFNEVKKMLNKISIKIPDWVPMFGGNTWGFNFKMSDEVELPRLAKGNVAYEPMTAIFGEYANARQNPEVTSPVSIMADTFRNVLEEFDFGGTRIDTLKIDVAGDNFYQGAVDYINNENARNGVSIIKEV